jgi:hypothetical protein
LNIIEDRCPLAELGVEILKQHDQQSIPFSFQTFLFPGQEETGIHDVKCHLLGTGFQKYREKESRNKLLFVSKH